MPEINGNESDDGNLDLCWGASEIGQLIGREPRSVYHMCATGQLPGVKQIGRKLVASKSQLRKIFES